MYSWQNIKKRIAHIHAPVGAEIGVHRGHHAGLLLRNIPGLTLYMIDAWSPSAYTGRPASPELLKTYGEQWLENYVAALDAVREFGGRAVPIRGRSLDVGYALKGHIKFDFGYLDAAHDEMSVGLDSRCWIDLIKPGGWLCGHDYNNPEWPGVKKAVDELFGDRVEVDTDFTWFYKLPEA